MTTHNDNTILIRDGVTYTGDELMAYHKAHGTISYHCSQCGHEIELHDGSYFCGYCGYDTRVQEPIPELIGSDGKMWPGTFDASIWARAFIMNMKDAPTIATDEECMLGWFANAIMVGYDKGKSEIEKEGT